VRVGRAQVLDQRQQQVGALRRRVRRERELQVERPQEGLHVAGHGVRVADPVLVRSRRGRQPGQPGLEHLGTDEADVPHQIYVATLLQSGVLAVVSPLAGRLSDRVGRRKVFVAAAAGVYALAMTTIAAAGTPTGYLVGMAVGGLGFGMYMAVDLALVVDVLPATASAAKDLGVLNVAGALPFAVAPALAPAILGVTGHSYAALYVVAAGCALAGAADILPVRAAR